MSIFYSPEEKRLWLYTLLVFVAIITTLFLGNYFVVLFGDEETQASIGMLCMILIGATILVHGLKTKPEKLKLQFGWVLQQCASFFFSD